MKHIFYLVIFIFAAKVYGQSPYKNLIDSAGDAAAYEGQSQIIVFDSSRVDVDSTGLSHKRVHTLTKVLTAEGNKELRAIRFDYDPATNVLKIEKANIHRSDGRVEAIEVAEASDQPQPQHLIYWGARMRVLPIPPLETGDALEVEYTSVGFVIAYLASDGEMEQYIPPMRGTYYDVIYFGGDVTGRATPPMKLKSYTITMPEDKPSQYESFNGEINASMKFENGRNVYHFSKENVAAYQAEPRAPDVGDCVPKVVFTNVKSWAEKSKWFYGVNEDRDIFAADDEIRRMVKEITQDAASDSAKIKSLLHWVAQGIRYSGINMGKGEGYTIHPSTMTFRDRAGVCKDIAGMLVTMLRVAGYNTFPVMTQAGARVEDIPADQFNHCVVAVKKPDGSFLMLDPTWCPFNMDIWSRSESEQHFVVGTGKGEDLKQISKFAAEDNDFSVTLNTRLDEDGNLYGKIDMIGKSAGDARLRRPFSDAGKDQWNNICRDWLTKTDKGAELVKASYGDLWDFHKPFTVRLEFKVPFYARSLENRLDYVPFSAKLIWAGGSQMNIMTDLKAKTRTQPVFTYSPRQVTLNETLTIPSGYQAGKLPEARSIGSDEAFLRGGWTQSGNRLELRQLWRLKDRQMPKEKYTEIKKTLDALKDTNALAVILSRKGRAK